MPSKDIERALELRAGDIVFYSSSHPSSWLNKWGQTALHNERVDTTHAAIALAPQLILEANPRGLADNAKGVAEETKLSYPKDFKKIRYVFRNPDTHDFSDAIANAAIFFRGEAYDFLTIFTSQLLPRLKKTRGAQQYGKTFCSALVQGVAEKSNLIPPHPTGQILSPHALLKYLKTLGWEQIEGSRFIRSAAEEDGKTRSRQLLVGAGLDSELVDRADKLSETIAERLKDLISTSEPVWRAMVSLLPDQHRLLAEWLELDSILKQAHPDRHEALARLRERHSDRPNFLQKITAHALRAHNFPLDLLNLTPFVSHLKSIQTVVSKVGHYVANEINNFEKMKRDTIKWMIDEADAYEREARTQITETMFYSVYELYLSDSIQERMEQDTKLRNAMAEWAKRMDQIATSTAQSALAHDLSLSKSRERFLELKQLCTSVLTDENDLRSRLEILLAEREKYVGLLEDWPELRSAERNDSSNGGNDAKG